MIQRRWPETLLAAAASLALLCWSRALFHASFFWGAAAAFLGAGLGAVAVLGPASGPCPLCAEENRGLWALSPVDMTLCPHCRAYYRISDGKEVSADFIAKAPYFSVPVVENRDLPELCCVCGVPAEKVQGAVHRAEGRVSNASPLVAKTEIALAVPYCARHDGGVAFWDENGWVMKVRSYGFYRAAVLKK